MPVLKAFGEILGDLGRLKELASDVLLDGSGRSKFLDEGNFVVFTGNFTGRGESVSTMSELLRLKMAYPRNVSLLWGVNEVTSLAYSAFLSHHDLSHPVTGIVHELGIDRSLGGFWHSFSQARGEATLRMEVKVRVGHILLQSRPGVVDFSPIRAPGDSQVDLDQAYEFLTNLVNQEPLTRENIDSYMGDNTVLVHGDSTKKYGRYQLGGYEIHNVSSDISIMSSLDPNRGQFLTKKVLA